MKLKLISDGTPTGTKVVNAETNELIEGVFSIHYYAQVNKIPYVTMRVWLPDVEVIYDTDSYEVYKRRIKRKEIHTFVPKSNI